MIGWQRQDLLAAPKTWPVRTHCGRSRILSVGEHNRSRGHRANGRCTMELAPANSQPLFHFNQVRRVRLSRRRCGRFVDPPARALQAIRSFGFPDRTDDQPVARDPGRIPAFKRRAADRAHVAADFPRRSRGLNTAIDRAAGAGPIVRFWHAGNMLLGACFCQCAGLPSLFRRQPISLLRPNRSRAVAK
jgi:hypothetical protein